MGNRYLDESLVSKLTNHIGHNVHIAGYGLKAKEPWQNVALECEDCGVVIMDWNVHKYRGKYIPDKEDR